MCIPLIGIFFISTFTTNNISKLNTERTKVIGLSTTIINLIISLIIFIIFEFSTNQFQFVQEYYKINSFDIYLGVDGLSIYFILLTTLIMPITFFYTFWLNIIH